MCLRGLYLAVSKAAEQGGDLHFSAGAEAHRVQGEPGPRAAGRDNSANTSQIALVWASWRSGTPAGFETGGWPAEMGRALPSERSRALEHPLLLKRMLGDKGSDAASAACPHPWVPAAVLLSEPLPGLGANPPSLSKKKRGGAPTGEPPNDHRGVPAAPSTARVGCTGGCVP